jgi:HD-GYP domain-containing protein (c-di-GMP phosphodiesterase class II)
MTPSAPNPPLPRPEDDAYHAVRERCGLLGHPTWLCDLRSGAVVAEPPQARGWGAPVRSRAIRERVAAAVRARADEKECGVVDLDAGCWLIVLPPASNARGAHRLVALALGESFPESALYAEACAEAGPRARKGGAAAPPTCRSAEDAARIARILAWMLHDQLCISRDKASLDGFGLHLAEMYEEIGLLYRLGRSMSQLARPDEFVENACADLQQTLSFAWIAARFVDTGRAAVGVAGQLVVAGRLPCDEEQFDAAACRLLQGANPERWTLATPRGSDLARLVGSEVLVHPITRDDRTIGVLLAGGKPPPDMEISSFETQLLDAVADCIRVFIENADLYADQLSLFVGTVEALAAAIDAKDRYTCGHSQRVAHLARDLALATGMDDVGAERIRISGLLHDVGKIGVPEAILCKPGRLTKEEFDQIKLHPRTGERILKDIPFLDDILPGVLYHHERLDGKGYPDGLKGEDIPMIARILAVADAFDAMSTSRSYRPAMTRDQVLAELRRGAGTQFDPTLVEQFLTLDLAEYDRMVAGHTRATGLAA